MKLRYFSDDFMEFTTEVKPNLHNEPIEEPEMYCFSQLKDSIPYLHQIQDSLSPEDKRIWMPTVYLSETSRRRSSTPNNILYFCEQASFLFDLKIKLYRATFKFRDIYDLNSGGAVLYAGSEHLEFYDYNLGDRNADDYFRNKCEDRELADFLLSIREPITY